MDIKQYAEQQAKKVDEIFNKHYEDSQLIMKEAEKTTKVIGRETVELPTETVVGNIAIAKNTIVTLKQQRDEDIQKIIDETNAVIGEQLKKAAQEYYAAEPIPTEDDLKRVSIIKDQYLKGNAVQPKFFEDMEYHVENQTVKAYPFYLVATEIVSDTDFSTRNYLNEALTRIFPELTEKAAALAELTEAQNIVRAAFLKNRMEYDKDYTSIESISMKQELYRMGRIAEINQGVASNI